MRNLNISVGFSSLLFFVISVGKNCFAFKVFKGFKEWSFLHGKLDT